ncbi:opioid growth factor receptor-related protein [Caenispirillum bisanense]|uniref:opioid growth factor receptor-related protein n=1 Tax=Caenispirillum bisanense TaxID=414052 RepID=UPI0031E18BEA
MSEITDFYCGDGRDHRGRSLDDICRFDATRLETVHDFVQWLFPLPEASAFNAFAPLLTDDDIAAIRGSAVAQDRLRQALAAMGRRLGFTVDGDAVAFPAGKQAPDWFRDGDHNTLRVTRMIRSLHLLSDSALAAGLQDQVLALAERWPGRIGPRTRHFWQTARDDQPG